MGRLVATAAGALCALLAACGGSGNGGGTSPGGCSDTREKRFVLDTAREWYLFDDLLPAGVGAGDYATAEELLDALTAGARAEGKDRYFSYLTSRQADDAIFQAGQFIGFGFRTRIEGDRLWLTDVYEDSPAEDGGLARGVEITEIDSGSGFVPVATVLAGDPELEEAFGPADEGVERGIRFLLPGGGSRRSRHHEAHRRDHAARAGRRLGPRPARESDGAGRLLQPALVHYPRPRRHCVTPTPTSAHRASSISSWTCATTAAGWSASPN